MSEIKINVTQVSDITSEATVRTHKILVDRPQEKGGEDNGAMGGELFLVALGGCFMSNLLAAILAREVNASGMSVDVYGKLEDTPPRFTQVTLKISGNYSDSEEIERLALMSEKACIVANTIKGSVTMEIIVN
ncbi:MAG: OsmC family protein [Gammaproteobacteria bacterium]|jgi:putative redox protein